MVNFRTLGQKAKDLVDKRGGTESLKQDAEELKRIAGGKGSISDKAKAAAAALKDPGSRGAESGAPAAAESVGSGGATAPPPAADEPTRPAAGENPVSPAGDEEPARPGERKRPAGGHD